MKYILLLALSVNLFAAKKNKINDSKIIKEIQVVSSLFYDKENSKRSITHLRNKVMKLGPKSVPILIRVMKDKKVSDKKRWMATFSLGRIMGKKSAKFISKFTKHPNWMLRLASIKTLRSMNAIEYAEVFADALKDKSMIVRLEALETVKTLKLKKYASNVWSMMFHKHNYVGKKGKLKRTQIIGKVIRTVGDLKYSNAKKSLVKLIQSKKYKDLVSDIDYSLIEITGKSSPKSLISKQKFWASL